MTTSQLRTWSVLWRYILIAIHEPPQTLDQNDILFSFPRQMCFQMHCCTRISRVLLQMSLFLFDFLTSSFSVLLFSFFILLFLMHLVLSPLHSLLNTFHLILFPPVISTKAIKKYTVKCTFEIAIYYITTNKTSP